MYLSDAVRERIKFYQKKNGMSLWALFKASGVPISTLAAFMSKRTELIKLDTLLHICEGFGITITEFFKDDIFKEKLGRISIKELSRTAKDRRSGSLGFAEAILIGYNKKCRNPLPWDKLYTHKLPQKKADEPELEEETDDMPQNGQLDLFGLGDDEEVSE